MSTASSYTTYIPENESEVFHPKSKRKLKFNSKGEIISDTKEKGKEEEKNG
jgi:hypothetical protein